LARGFWLDIDLNNITGKTMIFAKAYTEDNRFMTSRRIVVNK